MRKLIALLAFVAAAGCGSDKVTNPASDSIAGTFSVTSVDGNPLPYTVQSGTSSATLTTDVLTVADGGTWTETWSYTLTVNGSTTNQTQSDGGTWTRSGAAVSFYSNLSSAVAYTGTFTGGGFTLSDGTSSWLFAK
jgi:hypothetical protein